MRLVRGPTKPFGSEIRRVGYTFSVLKDLILIISYLPLTYCYYRLTVDFINRVHGLFEARGESSHKCGFMQTASKHKKWVGFEDR
jgi:hypothetical protein